MPTINQLIRSPRSKQLKEIKFQHLKDVLKKGVFAQEYTQQHQKNQIQL